MMQKREKPGSGCTRAGLEKAVTAQLSYTRPASAASASVTVLPKRRISARRRASWRLSELYRLAQFRRFHGIKLDPNTWAFCLAATLASAPAGISPISGSRRGVRWHSLDILSLKRAIAEADIGHFGDAELATVIAAVSQWQERHPLQIIKADTMAKMLAVTAEERAFCAMTTIGAVDESREERNARSDEARAIRDREHKRTKRAGKHKPRLLYLQDALSTLKPWEADGVSRATWYRRQRETSVSPYQLDIHSEGDRPVSADGSPDVPEAEEKAA